MALTDEQLRQKLLAGDRIYIVEHGAAPDKPVGIRVRHDGGTYECVDRNIVGRTIVLTMDRTRI